MYWADPLLLHVLATISVKKRCPPTSHLSRVLLGFRLPSYAHDHGDWNLAIKSWTRFAFRKPLAMFKSLQSNFRGEKNERVFPSNRDQAQGNSWALHCQTTHLILCRRLGTAQGGTKHYTMDLVRFSATALFWWVLDHGPVVLWCSCFASAWERCFIDLQCNWLTTKQMLTSHCVQLEENSSREKCDVLPPLRGLLEWETTAAKTLTKNASGRSPIN